MQKPSVGRIVWYGTRKNGTPTAAIVTTVHSDTCVSLCTFPHGAPPMPVTSVQHADVPGADPVWAWPVIIPQAGPRQAPPAAPQPEAATGSAPASE